MSAKDTFHDIVKQALLKDCWIITADPLYIRIEAIQMYIDLGAEKLISADKGNKKIAVEIKSFLQNSTLTEFYQAFGQFLSYKHALEMAEPERELYLAVPCDVYDEFFKQIFVQELVQRYAIKLLIYKPETEELLQWIT
jgi:glucose-6-phosphate 1-dehydrogenase